MFYENFDLIPARITMLSTKKCWKKMIVKFDLKESDGTMTCDQYWNSWENSTSGYYEARFIPPINAKNVSVSFQVAGGHSFVQKWDRKNRRWAPGKEVFELQNNCANDFYFYLQGTSLNCAVTKAWNAASRSTTREAWEFWPNHNIPQTEIPAVIQAYLNHPRNEHKLAVATVKMMNINRVLFERLQQLSKKHSEAYWGINLTKTAAAGLSIGAVATIEFPPAAVGMGVAAGIVSLSASIAEKVNDALYLNSEFAKVLDEYQWELSSLLLLCKHEECLKHHQYQQTQPTLQPALSYLKNGSVPLCEAILAAIETAGVAVSFLDDLAGANAAAVSAGEATASVVADAAAVSKLSLSVGIIGAVISTADCVYSWSTDKGNVIKARDLILCIEKGNEVLEQKVAEYAAQALQQGQNLESLYVL